ncbi:hypothetical protein EJ08DRAFT_184168 [Tothia fuscella]|uniref:Uncharacterized protein n=1 Tax=Tothia fuscella TaxID=1048955 RepID=A0A9P4TZ53_9PEZI|nr:hypothetical protein EJ08DRAFT_184168 [Tothia fuscella]
MLLRQLKLRGVVELLAASSLVCKPSIRLTAQCELPRAPMRFLNGLLGDGNLHLCMSQVMSRNFCTFFAAGCVCCAIENWINVKLKSAPLIMQGDVFRTDE